MINNKKFTPLSKEEIQNITGGKWETRCETRAECIQMDASGTICEKAYIYSSCYQVKINRHGEAVKYRDSYTDVYSV